MVPTGLNAMELAGKEEYEKKAELPSLMSPIEIKEKNLQRIRLGIALLLEVELLL